MLKKYVLHCMMAFEKAIHFMLDEVAMMLYTFQLEYVHSIKMNYFSKNGNDY